MNDEQVAALLDKQELAELTMRLCRGIDRGDESLILSCYHPDGSDDHGPTYSMAAPAEFATKIVASVRAYESWHHQLGGQLFELHGDTAFGESYFTFHSVTNDGVLGFTCHGRYLDHFERRDGKWRIFRRSVVLDWKGEADGRPLPLDGWARSRPNRSDGAYDIAAAVARPGTAEPAGQ